MRSLLQTGYKKVQGFRQNLCERKRVHQAEAHAKNYGFQPQSVLGKGKDAIVLKARKENSLFVVKVLSPYAKAFLPITKDFLQKCHVDELLDVQILDDSILYYSFREMASPNTNPKDLLLNFSALCDFEQKIIEHGFVMWDFGISGTNYMIDNGRLKIIDYGGNAFLYLNPQKSVLHSAPRKNLVYARNEFLQQALLLHFIILGIGQTPAAKWASWIQDHENLEESKQAILKYVQGTIYEKLADFVFTLDLCTKAGWQALKEKIKVYFQENAVIALDKADIDQIVLGENKATVTGYQNYVLTPESLTPMDRGHEWANTKMKWGIISGQMRKLSFQTFLDIGSNLGLYVFTANVLCKAKATGIDYNQEYIDNCKKVAQHLNLNCEFITKEFGKIDQVYECVSMLGVIHHIYSRTESFGNLEKIIQKIDSISQKYVIIEFPTENDSKAMKWIKIPSRETSNDYTLQNFLKVSEKYFRKVTLVDSTTPDRPVYLLEK